MLTPLNVKMTLSVTKPVCERPLSRDERDGIYRARYTNNIMTLTHFKHHHRVLWLISKGVRDRAVAKAIFMMTTSFTLAINLSIIISLFNPCY